MLYFGFHRGSGGIGRRASLRSWWPKGRRGSSPFFRTLLAQSSSGFFFDGTRIATARFAPTCRSGELARLPPPEFPASVFLRARGPVCVLLPAAIPIGAWRRRADASTRRPLLRLTGSSWFSRLEV